MSDQRKSGIEWTDQTWNPIRGCSKVSQGCKHCYAETMAARFSKPGLPYEKVITNGRWNGDVVLVPEHLADPLRWQRPRRVFVNSMSDLFHESLSFEGIAAVFGVMAAVQRHTFQVLTKRPARALAFFQWLEDMAVMRSLTHFVDASAAFARRNFLSSLCNDLGADVRHPTFVGAGLTWPLPNVWLGVTIEDQATADERIPLLLQCPAAVRWVSAEPLLGPIVLKTPEVGAWPDHGLPLPNPKEWDDWKYFTSKANGLGWVVVGGESGPGARPMHPDWARSLRDQCVETHTPFLFKQWGDWKDIGDAHDLAERGLREQDNERVVNLAGGHGFHGEAPRRMRRVGKHAAGRELDGKVWDGYPAEVHA